MAIASHAGVLKQPCTVKKLGRNEHMVLEPGTKVRYYRNPMQLGVWIIEYHRVYFARLDAVQLRDYIE